MNVFFSNVIELNVFNEVKISYLKSINEANLGQISINIDGFDCVAAREAYKSIWQAAIDPCTKRNSFEMNEACESLRQPFFSENTNI